MKPKFTPGPWRYFTDHDDARNVLDAKLIIVARVFSKEEVEANARLIAAAPDLFKACCDAFNALRGSGRKSGDPILLALESAITKAEGVE